MNLPEMSCNSKKIALIMRIFAAHHDPTNMDIFLVFFPECTFAQHDNVFLLSNLHDFFFFCPLTEQRMTVLHGLLGRAHGFGMEKIGAANGGEGESRGVWVWRFTEGRCLILRATTEINSKLVPLNANGAASIFKRASKFVLTPAIALNQTCN